MNCPCEKCLVRSTCRNKIIGKHYRIPDKETLILEYAEQCPYIIEFFGRYDNGRIRHIYEKIYSICDSFGLKDKHFVWFANEIGL